MQPEFWNDKRPAGVPNDIDMSAYRSVVEVFERACKAHADRPAFTNMGVTLTYSDLERHSAAFAAWLQNHTDLQPGERIAVQMPNLLQYPIAVFGALRAGLVVVNTNPLYTVREMRHQFQDSGVRALVYLNTFGRQVQEVLADTRIDYLIEAKIGDLLPGLKGALVNAAVRHVKKMVPAYSLPQAVSFKTVLREGARHSLRPVPLSQTHLAVLQYTGGTTGVAKGAMLSHGNLVANMQQVRANMQQLDDNGHPVIREGQEVMIAPLPLYHIYAFTVNCMCMMVTGNHNVLITNPRDINGFVKELQRWRFSGFLGLNTLFVALMSHPDFRRIDFSALKGTNSGGTALVSAVAERWQQLTGCTVVEGYGLTETSPDRRARREIRRGGQAVHRAARARADRRGAAALLPREFHRLQAAAPLRPARLAADDPGGQDPASRVARHRLKPPVRRFGAAYLASDRIVIFGHFVPWLYINGSIRSVSKLLTSADFLPLSTAQKFTKHNKTAAIVCSEEGCRLGVGS